MCYSTRSSLIAWAVSMIIAAYLYRRNNKFDRWNAAFIVSFAMVQLCEAGIWSSPDKRRTSIYLGLLLIALYSQPLVQTYGAWTVTKSDILKIMTIVYAIMFIYAIYRAATEKFYSTVGPNGHLVWNAQGTDYFTGGHRFLGILYLIGLFLGLLWVFPNSLPLIAVGAITFIWSMSRVSTGEFGSYWCYTAVAYSLMALFCNF